MKKIVIILLVLAAAALGWQYRYVLKKFTSGKLSEIANTPLIQNIKQDVSTPPPLISNIVNGSSYLTNIGTIDETNLQRAQNGGLPALKENDKLDQAAAAKLKDMFAQQYFEHVNPQGIGPADLAKKAGYSFLAEGENLALGNFKNDQALLEAWMNSPGHRANILNTKYTEIGVAVGKGTYQGKSVWMAVQEFGRPTTDCPSVSTSLDSQIQTLKTQVDAEAAQLATEKAQLEASSPKTKSEYDAYNAQVDAYNAQVKDYNAQLESLKTVIGEYNAQVNAYNACLSK